MRARLWLLMPTSALLLAVPAHGSVLLFLDEIDDYRFVRDVVETEPMKAQSRELERLKESDRLLKLAKVIESGSSTVKDK